MGSLRLAVAVSAVALLAGCAAEKQATKQPEVGTTAPTATTSDTTSAPVTTPAETATSAVPDDPDVAKFGQTFTYEDGLAVTAGKPTVFKRGQYAEKKPGTTPVMFVVKITNGTDKPFDAALATMDLKTGADGNNAEQVYDSDAGLSSFEGTITRGRTATARVGFNVPNADVKLLILEVSPGFLDREAAIFEGAL